MKTRKPHFDCPSFWLLIFQTLPTHFFQCILPLLVCTCLSHAFWYHWYRVRIHKKDTLLSMTMRQRPYSLLIDYTTVSNAKLNIWKFMYKYLFSCEFLPHGFGLGLLGCRIRSAALHHSANCAARQYLFGFDETMPLATNHKFSLNSISKVNLPYHLNDFRKRDAMIKHIILEYKISHT